jgi:hypothetical protein
MCCTCQNVAFLVTYSAIQIFQCSYELLVMMEAAAVYSVIARLFFLQMQPLLQLSILVANF